MRRLIGEHIGAAPGPLVIAFGAMHGNEDAGVSAIKEVFSILKMEQAGNPGFQFSGKFVGLIGNLQAFSSGQRFLNSDLNRQWTTENIHRIHHTPFTALEGEDVEVVELMEFIHNEIRQNKPDALILLDLHTTSAEGGIFCIPTDDKSSLRLAKALHAPVILGLLEGIDGTLLRYAAGNHLQIEGYPKHTLGVAFESGQHEDPLSVSRAISAIISCLRASGCLKSEDIDTSHDLILKQYSDHLPKVTRLRHVHKIRPGDAFKMRPGYVNFQAIRQNEHLADDITGPIYATQQGLILMPLYQSKGADGFFIVEALEGGQLA